MLAEGVGYGKSGVGMERFVDFHLRVEKLTRYYVASHHTPIWVPLFRATLFFYLFFFLSFFWIIMALFRNTVIERKVGSTKLLHFTVFKKELLKRILLSGFKLGWSIAMILYIARTHEFQIASHPYLD